MGAEQWALQVAFDSDYYQCVFAELFQDESKHPHAKYKSLVMNGPHLPNLLSGLLRGKFTVLTAMQVQGS